MRAIVPRGKLFPVRVGVCVKVRVSFRVGGGGATRQLPQRKIPPGLGLGFGLELVFGLGGGRGGQFSSGTIVLEPKNNCAGVSFIMKVQAAWINQTF